MAVVGEELKKQLRLRREERMVAVVVVLGAVDVVGWWI